MVKILICGAGGFIGGAMVKRLKKEGFWVRGVDIKAHEFLNMNEIADDFIIGDLRDPKIADAAVNGEIEHRRRRKLRVGDVVIFDYQIYISLIKSK